MPPPVNTSFEIFKRLLIPSNFEDTFAPPTMDKVGVSLEFIALINAFVSSSNKSPAQEVSDEFIAPKVEAWERWDVPKTSNTYTSAKLESCLDNFLI